MPIGWDKGKNKTLSACATLALEVCGVEIIVRH
jgi:hypothetical protein